MSEQNDTCKASLESVLEANRALQQKLSKILQEIFQRKHQNRRTALRCLERLRGVQVLGIGDGEAMPKQTLGMSNPTVDDLSALFPPSITNARLWNRQKWSKRKHFEYDFKRRWNWEFFCDPLGSKPSANIDTKKRRKLEASRSFHHKSPPFSKSEREALKQLFQSKGDQKKDNDGRTAIDYEAIAQRLLELSKESGDDKSIQNSWPTRTAEECKVYHQHAINCKERFSKEESLKILEEVQISKDKKSEFPDWHKIAATTSLVQNNNRNVWDTYSHYRQKLEKPANWNATTKEDRLVTQYAALQGPQYVWDNKQIAQFQSRLLPTVAAKRIQSRSDQTLLNPKFTTEFWTEEAKRKLVLCMKIYKNDPSPILSASTHFSDRSSAQVSHKWTRTLNPAIDTSPLTHEEDLKLREVVQTMPSDQTWPDLAREHFPTRGAYQIYQRWTELATTREVVSKYATSTLLQGIKIKDQELQFSPEDFKLVKRDSNHQQYGNET